MMRMLLIGAAVIAVGAAGVIYLAGEPSDEDQIRAAIDQIIEGVESEDMPEAIEPISEHYRDSSGLGRDQIRGLLFREFQRRDPLSIASGPVLIQIDEQTAAGKQTATVSFEAAIIEGFAPSELSLLPTDGELFRFILTLAHEEDGWRVTSHTRDRLIQ